MITTITFLDTEVPPGEIEGILASLYQGDSLIVSSTSDVDGEVTFDLAVGTYHMIVSYPGSSGYQVSNPYVLEIVSGVNAFSVSIELFDHPTAVNPAMCLCSGYFYDSSGALIDEATIQFRPKEFSSVVGTIGVLGRPLNCTVEDGYAELDLERGALYRVKVPWFSPAAWEVWIPDRSWANLPDVLYPIPSSVVYTPISLSMGVNDATDVTVSITHRSGLVLSGDVVGEDWPVEFTSSDESVVTVTENEDGTFTARALSVGTATISAARTTTDDPIRLYADPGVSGTLAVVVS